MLRIKEYNLVVPVVIDAYRINISQMDTVNSNFMPYIERFWKCL